MAQPKRSTEAMLYSLNKNVFLGKCIFGQAATVFSGKCVFGKIYFRTRVFLTNCIFGQMDIRAAVYLCNIIFWQVYFWENVILSRQRFGKYRFVKCSFEKLSFLANVVSSKLDIGQIVLQRNSQFGKFFFFWKLILWQVIFSK